MNKKLWGGRFKKKPDTDFFKFQKSINYDYKLAQYDVLHSLIHIDVLKKAGILNKTETNKLIKALNEVDEEIKQEINKKKFKAFKNSEDIHTEIQNRVEKKVGLVAYKLHTLRSRNDQIVFDEKYYCLEKSLDIRELLLNLRETLVKLVKHHKGQKIIGYTHTQRAQVVLFQEYIFAFNHMFAKDYERLQKFSENLQIYIGAGALIGFFSKKAYNEAADKVIGKLEWKYKPLVNSLHNVSDRDFIIELLSILSILQMHLSRMAEDFILYSTKEFNFLDLPEEFCTGSSLLPHKKNPDFLELVRGNTGRIYGNLVSILTIMKGLPLTYNRDMQLDKEPLFSSVEIIEEELKIMARFIKGIDLKIESIDNALKDKTLYATKLVKWFVMKQKISFKKAHNIVGKLTMLAEEKKGDFAKIPSEKLKGLHPKLDEDIINKIMRPK
ncbi:MAG: argininosuccinate lyase [Candidatus Omnitrophica bacterium]|nr:argininosuccinate lyase [Candidatus Omnitrophota bacterium]